MKKLIVIAGSGKYPQMIIEGAKKAGVECVDVMAVRGSTARATINAADHVLWGSLDRIAESVRLVGSKGYEGAILAGQINPLSLFRSRFDAETKAWLAELPGKNAHSIYGKLIEKFEFYGTKMLPASLFMDDFIPGAGVLTARSLSEEEEKDVKYASMVANDVGIHDVGQTVMVKRGMVLAVEAFEGTNAAIKRGGKLGGKGAVVFKVARNGHDMRFDIPVIGLKTMKVLRKAGVTALAFQANRLVMLDRQDVLAFANRYNIAIAGIATALPPAPLRP